MLFGLGVALLAITVLKSFAGHAQFDFTVRQMMALVAGTALVLEGALGWRSGRRGALWAALLECGPAGTVAATALAVAAAAGLLLVFRDYRVDDSFITFRFARNLAEGHGVTWNVGEAPVEGYSNFLWMLLSAGAQRLGFDPLAAARATAVACHVAAAVVLYRLVSRLTPAPGAPRLAVVLFAAIPAFALWTMSGLETSSVVLFSLLYFASFAREFPASRVPSRTAACVVLLMLSRPEAPLLVGLSLMPALFSGVPGRWRWAATLALLCAPAIGIYEAWKWATFGALVANTAVAKMRPLAGLDMAGAFFALVFPLAITWIARRGRTATLTERQIAWAAAGVLLVAVNIAPQVAHQYRFFLPVLAPLVVLAALAATGADDRGEAAMTPGIVGVLAIVFVLLPVFALKIYADREIAGLEHAHTPLGAYLARAHRPDELLAASDCGIIPWISRMRTLDMWGLTDRTIATRGFSAAYVMSQKPAAVVIHSLQPDRFSGREFYDSMMYTALARDPAYRMTGRWEFYGYWLWLFERAPQT